MEGNAGGWGAVELPSTSPALGTVLESAIKQNYQNAELGLKNKQQQERYNNQLQRDQASQYAQGMSLLSGLPKQYNSNNIDILKVRDGFLGDHMKDMQEFAKTHSKAETEAEINRIIEPFSKWYDVANATYENSVKNLDKWHQENPNVDYNDAKELVNHNFSNDFFKDDGTGKITYNTDVRPSNYISKLDEPVALKNMRVSGKPLIDFTKSLPYDNFETSVSQNNKGHVISHDVSARLTPFSTKPFIGEDGSLKTELASNNVHGTKQITPEFEQVISSNKPLMNYLLSGFEKQKDKLQQSGFPLDPRNEQDLFRSYAWHELNPIMPHQVRAKTKTIEPKPTQVRVTVNSGGASGGENIINAFGEISKRVSDAASRGHQNIPVNELSNSAQEALLEHARKINGGKGTDPTTGAQIPLNNSDIYVAHKNGNILLMKRTLSKDGNFAPIDNEKDQLITPLDKLGVNLIANKSLGVKAKKAVVSGSNEGSATSGVKQIKIRKSKGNPLGLNLP